MSTFDGFDWNFDPKLPKALILDLATLRFIPLRGGALILGATRLGKTHICVSIAVRAIEAGYTVLYRSAFDLAEDLAEGHPQASHRPPESGRPTHPRRSWRSAPAGHRC
jgi:DNA replication protein DnaC